MIRIVLFIFALFLWIAPVAPAIAQDTSSHNLDQLREFVAKHWPNIIQRGYHPEVLPTPTQDLHSQEQRQVARIHDIATSMLHKYEQRHAQHDDFLSKLDGRREKMHAEGADVTHIDRLIDTAHELHEQTQHVLEMENAKLESLHDASNAQTLHRIVTSDAARLHQAFVNEQAHMTDIVHAIRDETIQHQAITEPTHVPPSRNPSPQHDTPPVHQPTPTPRQGGDH